MIGKSSKKEKSVKFQFCFVFRSIRYNHDEPVQPRFELNAADLYIPSMAFVSYILVVGYMLGMQDRFAPDLLATTASSSLTMLVLELLVIYLTTTIMSINTTLSKCDIVAFCMYKYVGMILCLVMGLFFSTSGYYAALAYTALALALFLFRTLHLRVEPEVCCDIFCIFTISHIRSMVLRVTARGRYGCCLQWLRGSHW